MAVGTIMGYKVVSLILMGEQDTKCSHVCYIRRCEIMWRQFSTNLKRTLLTYLW